VRALEEPKIKSASACSTTRSALVTIGKLVARIGRITKKISFKIKEKIAKDLK
jgi:hypothetical protein